MYLRIHVYRNICDQLLQMLKPVRTAGSRNGPTKVLNAPVHLGSMAANLESRVDDIKSIWVMQRDDSLVSSNLLIAIIIISVAGL